MYGYESIQRAGVDCGEETSMKKYPYTKYYQFEDEDSSGRKFIRDKLNLCQNDPNLGNIGKQNDLSLYLCKQQKKKLKTKKKMHKKIPNKSLGSEKIIKNRSCNHSIVQSVNSFSNRNHHNNSIKWTKQDDSSQQQLKYYKKLCLNMRKKNTELEKQLRQCKQGNKKDIFELSKKLEKINAKCQEKKDTMDACKMEKILTSLKTIKGKLGKKGNQDHHEKKFYQFFMESLGVLLPQQQSRPKNYVELQVLWKQMLQFLVLNDFKLN